MDSPFGIALKKIEARITKSDEEGLRARWESGRKLLSQREGKLLPRGLLEAVATELGVSREELTKRMKFTEMYPTEDELRNAVTQFGSWHQIVAKGLTRQARPTDRVGVVVKELRVFIRRLRNELSKVHAKDLTESDLKILDAIQEEITRIYEELR